RGPAGAQRPRPSQEGRRRCDPDRSAIFADGNPPPAGRRDGAYAQERRPHSQRVGVPPVRDHEPLAYGRARAVRTFHRQGRPAHERLGLSVHRPPPCPLHPCPPHPPPPAPRRRPPPPPPPP